MATSVSDGFKKLLADLRHKYSLEDLRLILKDEDLGKAPGWEKLAERLDGGDAVLQAKANTVLHRLHADLILAGTKDVQIFDLPKGDGAKIAAAMDSLTPHSPNFSSAYPFSLSETDLRPLTTRV